MSGVQLVFCSLSPYDEETLGCRCTTEQQNCYRFYQLLPKHVVVPGYNNHTRKNHMLSIWDGKVLLMDKTSVKQLEMLTKTFVNHFGFSSPEFVHQQYIRTQHTHTHTTPQVALGQTIFQIRYENDVACWHVTKKEGWGWGVSKVYLKQSLVSHFNNHQELFAGKLT